MFPFLPGLCRHLLGEELRLPQATTWWLGQRAEREAVLAERDRWVIKNAFVSQRHDPVFLAQADEAEQREVLARGGRGAGLFRRAGAAGALHRADLARRAPRTPTPGLASVCRHARPDGPLVMPGGLTRVSRDVAGSVVTMQYGGLSKDTWVLGHEPEIGPPAPAPPVIVRPARPAAGVPSRQADHLYWLGRYAERLEHVVRLVRAALRRLSGEETGQQAAELEVLLHLLWHTRKLPRRRKEPARTPAEERAEEIEDARPPAPLDGCARC